jgi:hypothetical protein
MDETGWREVQQRAWLWTAVTAELTVFSVDRSRGGAATEALLGPAFPGVVGRIGGPPTTASRLSGGRYAMLT